MSIWNRLVRVTAPADDALSLDAAKAHLNLTGITGHDDNVTAFIADALANVEGPNGIGFCLITQTWRLSLDCWPRFIDLPMGPVQAVNSIKYFDPDGAEQTLAADQYVYDLDRKPLRIYPAEGVTWPNLQSGVPGVIKVEFDAGFGDAAEDVPADLVGALKLIVGHRFENRGSVDLPPAADSVLRRYRAGSVA